MTERKQQLELDFKRGAKLAIINKISQRGVFSPRMLVVLRAIDDRARDQAVVTMTYAEIGDYLHMSRATAKRGVADLVEHDLLSKTPVKSTQGQQANQYQLIWSNLQDIADGEPLVDPAPVPEESTGYISETPAPDLEYESSQVVISAAGHNEVDPGHHDPAPGSLCTPDPGHGDPAILYALSRINNHPPSKGHSWEGVEGILNSLGVGLPRQAVQSARDCGCSVQDVLALVEYSQSKPGAYGPGAIYQRVRDATPGGDPAVGWPPESAAWRDRQKQLQAQQKRTESAQQVEEMRAKKQASQESKQALEAEFGPVLDAMNRDERQLLARQCNEFLARQLARDPNRYRSGETRYFLLSKLKAGQAECLDNLNSAVAEEPAIADQR